MYVRLVEVAESSPDAVVYTSCMRWWSSMRRMVDCLTGLAHVRKIGTVKRKIGREK